MPCRTHPYIQSEEYLYDGKLGKGNYWLIKFKNEVIGAICYCCIDDCCEILELDIWMGAARHTGKGFGVEAISCLMDYLHKHICNNTFIIRPWRKNQHAIRAYNKAGFKEILDFLPEEFYSFEFLEWYADGDYGVETVNMIKKYG